MHTHTIESLVLSLACCYCFKKKKKEEKQNDTDWNKLAIEAKDLGNPKETIKWSKRMMIKIWDRIIENGICWDTVRLNWPGSIWKSSFLTKALRVDSCWGCCWWGIRRTSDRFSDSLKGDVHRCIELDESRLTGSQSGLLAIVECQRIEVIDGLKVVEEESVGWKWEMDVRDR